MDPWSEESSDEYVQAEQEAALYSVLHHEAANVAHDDTRNRLCTPSTPALNPPVNLPSSKTGHNMTLSQLSNQHSRSSEIGVNKFNSNFFEHIPECRKAITGQKSTESETTQSIIENSMGKNPQKSLNLSHISNQLRNVSGSDVRTANNFHCLSSEKLSYVKTKITSVTPVSVTQSMLEQNKPLSNEIDSRESNSTKTHQNTNLDINASEINTFSFDLKKMDLPKPVGNNLFSPFNARYLESKTSSEKVFRLDERLFLPEKFVRNVIVSSVPILAQESMQSNSLATIDKGLQKKSPSVEINKPDAQKTFAFDASHYSCGKKETSDDLNSTGSLNPQEPVSVPPMHVIDNKSKPPVTPKISKKAKKKLKILQANLLYNSIVNLKSSGDKVMVIGLKRPETKCEVIVLDKEGDVNSVDPDIIVLDSDSDESVQVVPVPSTPLPVIISVEDSSDDDRVVRLRPAVVVPFETDPDVAENSFDFLDNVIENCMGDFDGIRKAQANVLSNLISNHSSKESLVDERLFQVESAAPDQEIMKKTDELPHSDDDVANASLNVSPVLENDRTVHIIGNVEPVLDSGEPKTPMHSFKVPKSKVRTKTKQAKNVTNLPAVITVTLPSSDVDKSDDDIMVVHSGTKSATTIEEILSAEMKARFPEKETIGSDRLSSDRKRKREEKKISKKNKRKKKRATAESTLKKLISSHLRPTLFSYTKIAGDELVSKEKTPSRSPPTWTKEMKRFYNSSWGGENHDWKKIRTSMSAHPFSWQVRDEDRYPGMSGNNRPVRCRQCQRSGHFAWACPEIRTGTKCRMCGQPGHGVKDCPNSICLKCGQPSREFVKWCWQCKGNPFGECAMCVWHHNPAQPCKNYREQPAVVRPHVGAHAGYKGQRQRYGNNQPAERGYNPYYNKNFSRRPYL